ncbi:uncharacterized protein M421DRAFT_4971 [Didymella exigua CBS 183.55]|uniref:Uncharacterized protein n=1 Tax=Didymella exigua CBS 183.55 TaxID=1150837 RepID=A0A6A5RMK0_9PLEO|nr:uncharacterized protein M421DRAFT_4971 [Didymella exigua CBS 183.55]KAF1928500.1 hypothetical protein M421DRAFT_4971 [Didymella exigua CBS 183.55]
MSRINSPNDERAMVSQSELERRTQRNTTDSLLLQLPAELRNKVYEFVLEEAFVFLDATYDFDGSEIVSVTRESLTLPQVCRQIHHECLPFLNTFSTLTFSGLCAFESLECTLDNLGHNFDKVRVLKISMWTLTILPLGHVVRKMFKSLEQIVVRSSNLGAGHIEQIRSYFDRPNLEIIMSPDP